MYLFSCLEGFECEDITSIHVMFFALGILATLTSFISVTVSFTACDLLDLKKLKDLYVFDSVYLTVFDSI